MQGNVLVTGGAGFLGRGLMRRAEREAWDCRFIVYSRDEGKQAQCKEKYPYAEYVLGDVNDERSLRLALEKYCPDVVVHAGAMKYVPEGEKNVVSCINTNVLGTANIFSLVGEILEGCTVIYISTDKACRPVNTYGMTKSLGERMLAEYAEAYNGENGNKYVGTRYGNVIGSTGSVIPVFEHLIKEGKPVPVTDSNMTRFWMSINDAVDCIIEAQEYETGTICVPKCKAMTIGDVAKAMGATQTTYTGVRPGEKTNEELISHQESHRVTDGGRHYYQLHPVGHQPAGTRFQYVSDDPYEWMHAAELLAAYEDSKCV